jgi:hypothetical protein
MTFDSYEEVEKEVEEDKATRRKSRKKKSRLGTGAELGRMPRSYVYGLEYPTCWLHSAGKQVF